METLLAAGADVSARKVFETEDGHFDGRQVLHLAATRGHDSVASILWRKGAEKDALDDQLLSPLMWAAMQGHLPVVKVLLAAGANISIRMYARETGKAAVHFAASFGHGEIISELLQNGEDKDIQDTDGYTPLTWAAFKGHLAAVEVLLEAGASTNIRNIADIGAPFRNNRWVGAHPYP